MTTRRFFFGLLFASVILACFAGWLWIASGPRVTRERFEQVKEGMSREEVVRTVGGPAGDYSTHRVGVLSGSLGPRPVYLDYERWLCNDGELRVRFDDADTAKHVIVRHAFPLEPTLIERIRGWLGL